MSDTETTEETTTEAAEAAVETAAPASAAAAPSNLDFLLDVPVKLSAELGSCKMTMQELLDLEDECDLSKMRKQPNPYVSRLK